MEVNLERLEDTLNKAEVIYLSTSKDDVVSSRPVSPLNMGLTIYVRTSASSRKAKEMLANQNVAVCVHNFYFTARSRSLGSVFDESNAEIKKAYRERYPDAFGEEDTFIESDELFFEVVIGTVSEWIYDNGAPVGFAKKQLVFSE